MQPPAAPPHAAAVADVLDLIRSACTPLDAERMPLATALGHVLRETVTAREDQPPFTRSAVDGYAVRLDDPSTEFRIVDTLRAGDWRPRELRLGEAVRLATGAALPGDGLQVVMKEDVTNDETTVRPHHRDNERHVRERGEDARAGQPLVHAPTRLSAGALGLLASVGAAHPLVTRLPRVLHLATGNEIVPPTQTPAPGQIRDSNSTLVRAFLAAHGITPAQHHAPENYDAARALLHDPLLEADRADILLISGGASVGDNDFTCRLLEDQGYTILLRKTATRPGKPLIVARRGHALAFGLPGNPLAHFVCLHLFVQAALIAMAGLPASDPFQPGVLAADLAAGENARETLWPAHWQLINGAATLTPLRWISSGDLSALATANAFIRVAAGAGRLARGAAVEFAPTLSLP